jgi:hypothetical protein
MVIQAASQFYTPIHRLKLVASFALLGAVLAGSATVLPAVAAAVPLDLHALGAVVGSLTGAVVQFVRR